MENVSIDIKCAITTTCLTVLIYMLLSYLLPQIFGADGFGISINESTNWLKSIEIVVLVSVFIGFNLNNHFFGSCKVV